MRSLSRLKTSPGLLVRALVSLGALAAIGAAAATYASERTPPGAEMAAQALALVVIGALARRYGVTLPGNGFASYILGVIAYGVLDQGWQFAVLLAPLMMLLGDLGLRRLPPGVALGNAGPLPTGTAIAGLASQRLGGAGGPGGLDAGDALAVGSVLAIATVVSSSVIRRAVRADELTLMQGLSQAIAGDISLAKSFPRIQQLARRLVPWEHMGFARYDARTNEMELIADTAASGRSPLRVDAN